MRFQVNLDCTPEEARQFIGLPDLAPMQQELMEMVSRRLSDNIQSMEPEALMKTWVPALFQGWTDVQSQFWKQMTGMGAMKMGESIKNPMDFSSFGNFGKFTMSSSDEEDDKPKPRGKKR